MDLYQQYIHKSRYARWNGFARESWDETVERLINFWKNKCELPEGDYDELQKAIINLEVMPSMRSMWTAGEALEKNNMAGYNCSYIAVNSPRCFDEAMNVLMSGTGVGYSVENKYVRKLPIINDYFEHTDRVITVEDSREGWCKAVRKHIADLYLGREHTFDYGSIRPSGAKLVTMGGRASGPEPLAKLINFITQTFRAAAGRKLTSLECHDLMCYIGEVVVVGGVRRSAMISLSDLGDVELRDAKSGQWWESTAHRALANNSAVYESKPSMAVFMDEWVSLMKSGSGERGIFSRIASQKKAAENGRRKSDFDFGTNPCSEIILRSAQVCNLSEVVCREDDTKEDLIRKIRLAAILGTLQSTLTDFKYVRKIWKENTEEERLLGVSLTGIQDAKILRQPTKELLEALREAAVSTNAMYAELLGISQSTAVTCIKPSGTVSQLTNASSGIHGRFSETYIRRVRQDIKDPLTLFLQEIGIPNEQDKYNPSSAVFSFPVKSPVGCVLSDEQSALEQLDNWLLFARHWCEHKPSVTIYVRDDEWLEVGSWVYKHFDECSGVSFLPLTNHTYEQAPYEAITNTQYNELVEAMPKSIDWMQLSFIETDDNTEGAATLACTAGNCEI